MAAVTERLQFGTSVYIAPARDLFTVAKQVGTAAVLSNNRVNLGVGAGWMREEFAQTGQEYDNRGKRLDEMIPALRTLWSGGWVEHHGEHYDFGPLQIEPSPTQQVPIWCGGHSRAALKRAATPLRRLARQRVFGRGLRALRRRCCSSSVDEAGPRATRAFEIILGVQAAPTPERVRATVGDRRDGHDVRAVDARTARRSHARSPARSGAPSSTARSRPRSTSPRT